MRLCELRAWNCDVFPKIDDVKICCVLRVIPMREETLIELARNTVVENIEGIEDK